MIAPSTGRILAFAAIPTVAMSAGAVLAGFWTPSRRMRSLVQHFAAGVVFSVVSVELFPGFFREQFLWVVALGFTGGVALMLALRLLPGGAPPAHFDLGVGEERGEMGRGVTGLAVPIGIDSLLDGILIGIAFIAGESTGLLLALALALEMFSTGLALATAIQVASTEGVSAQGAPPRRSYAGPALAVALSLLIFVGALAGATIVAHLSLHALSGILAFASASLLFLVTEELLVRAHENAETAIATAMFFVGYLVFLLLGMLAQH